MSREEILMIVILTHLVVILLKRNKYRIKIHKKMDNKYSIEKISLVKLVTLTTH